MNRDAPGGGGDALEQARETIALQAEEIESLRRQLARESAARELREVFTWAAAAGAIASPVSHSRLIEMIVETAAHVISAGAAALFLIDQERQELTFEVVLGGGGEAVRKFRLPLGHGVPGLVAASGQPIAISDARTDPRQASDIADAVGYRPNSILCVPMFYNDQVIGVLELLDKQGASSFSTADMEALGLFANQAAVAIEQSRAHRNLAALICDALGGTDRTPDGARQGVQERALAFASDLEEDAAYRQALELARLVQEIVWRGESEMKACQTILRGFAEYLRSGSRPLGELGALR